MKLKQKKSLIIAVLGLLFLAPIQGQSRAVRKAQRKADQTEKRQERDYEKARKKALKRHYNIQSDRTKDMMRGSKKRSDNYNKRQKDPIWSRNKKKRKAKR